MQTSNIFPECSKTNCFANFLRGDKRVCNCLIKADMDCSFYQADPDDKIISKIIYDMQEYNGTKSLRHKPRI